MRSEAKSQARHARNDSAPQADKGRNHAHAAARKSFLSNHLSIIYHQLRLAHGRGFTVIVILLVGLIGKALGSGEPAPLDQALAAVRDCMARSPAPWPDAWQREYLDTIRRVVSAHLDAAQYSERLTVLSRGFQPYWEGLQKGRERSLFEVHCAEIRWYTECLLGAEFRGEEDTHALRYQYEDLFHYAAASLLAQFPFLDPNAVHRAEANHLAECYRRIDAPLLPIYLEPFSQAQMDRIKQRWHDLRYGRVDLWRQFAGGQSPEMPRPASAPSQVKASNEHPDYLLTQRSLGQLRAHIWAVGAAAPDYYRSAVANHINAQKRRFELTVEARNQERRLPRAVLQVEQISFLLGALLETARSSTESSPAGADGKTARTGLDRGVEGGDAHGHE
jgi:hypothetical protein